MKANTNKVVLANCCFYVIDYKSTDIKVASDCPAKVTM